MLVYQRVAVSPTDPQLDPIREPRLFTAGSDTLLEPPITRFDKDPGTNLPLEPDPVGKQKKGWVEMDDK